MTSGGSPQQKPPSPGWSTLSVHGGEEHEKARSALTDPIFLASTYSFADTQSLIDFIVEKQPREEYARYGNPTGEDGRAETGRVGRRRGRRALFGRDDGHRRAAAWASSATGDEIVLVDECYLRTRDFCLAGAVALRHQRRGWCRPAITRPWRRPSRPPRGCSSASCPPIRT